MLTLSPLFALFLLLLGTPVIAVASNITFDSPTNGTTWNVGLSPRVNVSWHIEGEPLSRIFYIGVLELYAGNKSLETLNDKIDPDWTQIEITLPALLQPRGDEYRMHLTFEVPPQIPYLTGMPPVEGWSDKFSIVFAPIAE